MELKEKPKLNLIWGGYSDWMIERSTPRIYTPPPIERRKDLTAKPQLTNYEVNPKRRRCLCVPGSQAIDIGNSVFEHGRVLALSLAFSDPFEERCLCLARDNDAHWNTIFNVWQIPIYARTAKLAVPLIWSLVESAYYDCNWGRGDIFLHWRLRGVRQEALEREVAILNGNYDIQPAWSLLDPPPRWLYLVDTEIDRYELEKAAALNFLEETGRCPIDSELGIACVNYLRHKRSAYEDMAKVRTRGYLKNFTEVNRAIAKNYPWLSSVCDQQIADKVERCHG